MPIKLYWTDALPEHYVAEDDDGALWMIPCAPMGPEVWQSARPYRGNYTLERVVPQAIERFYQRPQAADDIPEQPRMGRPRGNRPPTGRAQWTIRQDVLDAIRAEAARTGQHEYMVVEHAVLLAYPERFCK